MKNNDIINTVIGIAGLVGIGYALCTRAKLAKISERLDTSIDRLANDMEFDIPVELVNKAIEKAVRDETQKAVTKATNAAIDSLKTEIRTKVSIAINSEYDSLKDTIEAMLTHPIGVCFEGVKNENTGSGCFYFKEDDLLAFKEQESKKEDTTMFKCDPMSIKNVYFNDPVTVVIWNDGTKTIVRCSENDFYDPEKGLAMAIIKKVYGNDNSFHKIFKKWLPDESYAEPVSFEEFFANLKRILLGKD